MWQPVTLALVVPHDQWSGPVAVWRLRNHAERACLEPAATAVWDPQRRPWAALAATDRRRDDVNPWWPKP
jgi:hypothetical protein